MIIIYNHTGESMKKLKVLIYALLGIGCLVFTNYSFAWSTPLTMRAFLKTTEDDYQLKNHDELSTYLENATGSTPYLDKIEFRTETREFDPMKQKYSLRFYPKGWGETKYNRMTAKVTRKANRVEHEAYFNKALRIRYGLILDYLETMALLELQKKLLAVHEDRVSVFRKQSMSDIYFDLNTLIIAEDEYIKLRLNHVELKNKLTGILHKIKLAANNDQGIDFNTQNLISVDKIKGIINTLKPDPAIDNIYLKDRRLKIEVAETKYNLEIAKSREYISLFKVDYDSDDYGDLDKAVSLTIGFNLPFINPDKEAINRRKVGYMSEKLKYEAEKQENSEKIISLTRSLTRLIDQHAILLNRKTNGNAEISFQRYLKMEGIDPIKLLKIRESILENDVRLAKIYYRILGRYIELLNRCGRLTEGPLRNFISARMEAIS